MTTLYAPCTGADKLLGFQVFVSENHGKYGLFIINDSFLECSCGEKGDVYEKILVKCVCIPRRT